MAWIAKKVDLDFNIAIPTSHEITKTDEALICSDFEKTFSTDGFRYLTKLTITGKMREDFVCYVEIVK